jgi:phenylalanyl-tRNA synthetase beta chain
VTNPLSQDHSILRQSLIPSLLDVVSTNLRHGIDDVAIFEIGRGYAANGDTPREWWRLGFVLVGAALPPSWNQPRRAWDLDDAKGLLELLARRLGIEVPSYVAVGDEPSFHPGRTAAATARGRSGPSLHAIVGELHPAIADAWELRTSDRIVAGEVALTGLSGGGLAAERAPVIGRFQPVERDLAIVVRDDVPAASVLQLVRREGGEHVRDVRLFDIYRGTPLAPDEQSLAVRITLEALDRALTESEVEAAVASIVQALPSVGGRRRG